MIHWIGGLKVKNERLRSLREKRGLSQGEAANRMGLVRTTYSNYEAGNREPDNDTLKKFSDFFNVSIDYLLGNDDTNRTMDEQANNQFNEIFYRLEPDKRKIIEDMLKALDNERSKK